MTEDIPKRGRGRPPADITPEAVEKLSALQCTDEELAAYFNVTTRTIEKYRLKPEFKEAMERGKAQGRLSLRRAQFRAAVDNNNPAMLIWMGKQILDQRDKQLVDNNITGTMTQTTVTLTADEAKALKQALDDKY